MMAKFKTNYKESPVNSLNLAFYANVQIKTKHGQIYIYIYIYCKLYGYKTWLPLLFITADLDMTSTVTYFDVKK